MIWLAPFFGFCVVFDCKKEQASGEIEGRKGIGKKEGKRGIEKK